MLPAHLPIGDPPAALLPAREAAAGWSRRGSTATIELNWPRSRGCAELAYRCNLCRRCAQTCPIGVRQRPGRPRDPQALQQGTGHRAQGVARVGIDAPAEVGIDDRHERGRGEGQRRVHRRGDVGEDRASRSRPRGTSRAPTSCSIHNAGEILAWPENPGAFGLILNAAGISWTMSSEIAGYDSVNYGLWYDDAQFARVAVRHARPRRN